MKRKTIANLFEAWAFGLLGCLIVGANAAGTITAFVAIPIIAVIVSIDN